ncbi:unnamed protein product [Heterobilharzia americana]|nr:unnamed protein product [Heterobilharzia americana]
MCIRENLRKMNKQLFNIRRDSYEVGKKLYKALQREKVEILLEIVQVKEETIYRQNKQKQSLKLSKLIDNGTTSDTQKKLIGS